MTRGLEAPFARAAMLMFVLSEVHPFDDGNGRIARAFMNAVLISGGQRRILIPTAFRDEYLTGLRTLCRQRHPDAYLQILDYAQEYTWRIDFSDYDAALATLTETGAFEETERRSTLTAPGQDAPSEPGLRDYPIRTSADPHPSDSASLPRKAIVGSTFESVSYGVHRSNRWSKANGSEELIVNRPKPRCSGLMRKL